MRIRQPPGAVGGADAPGFRTEHPQVTTLRVLRLLLFLLLNWTWITPVDTCLERVPILAPPPLARPPLVPRLSCLLLQPQPLCLGALGWQGSRAQEFCFGRAGIEPPPIFGDRGGGTGGEGRGTWGPRQSPAYGSRGPAPTPTAARARRGGAGESPFSPDPQHPPVGARAAGGPARGAARGGGGAKGLRPPRSRC